MAPVLVAVPLTVGPLERRRDPPDATLGPHQLEARELARDGLTIMFTAEPRCPRAAKAAAIATMGTALEGDRGLAPPMCMQIGQVGRLARANSGSQ